MNSTAAAGSTGIRYSALRGIHRKSARVNMIIARAQSALLA
jgi:hypothetical protein